MSSRWRHWIAHRFGWGPIRDHFVYHRVPKTPWYYGDGATLLLLLGVLVATGGLMALTYTPSPDAAHESVQHITHRQTLGWLVRGLHYWSAGMMVVMVAFHLFRVILVGAYKAPREGTWLIGVVMLVLVLVMSFTGYVLRWDQRAIHGLRVALNFFYYVPLIGDELVVLVQGGERIGATTLTRLYGVHAILIPMLLLGLAAFHLYLVVVRGVTSPEERRRAIHSTEEQEELYEQEKQSSERGEDFHPYTTAKSGAFAVVVFLLVLFLAWWRGPHLWEEADLVTQSQPAEEWWFWWVSGLAALLPPWLAPIVYVVLPVAVLLFLLALPFIDRSPWRGARKRPVMVTGVVLCIVALLYLSDLRRRSPWTGWPTTEPPPLPEGVEPLSPDAEQGRQLFATFGCTSCHAVAGWGRQVGPDLARLDDRYSLQELRAYIEQPPEDVPMPAYEGRLTDEELDLVARYVLAAQTFGQDRAAEDDESRPRPNVQTPPSEEGQ